MISGAADSENVRALESSLETVKAKLLKHKRGEKKLEDEVKSLTRELAEAQGQIRALKEAENLNKHMYQTMKDNTLMITEQLQKLQDAQSQHLSVAISGKSASPTVSPSKTRTSSQPLDDDN